MQSFGVGSSSFTGTIIIFTPPSVHRLVIVMRAGAGAAIVSSPASAAIDPALDGIAETPGIWLAIGIEAGGYGAGVGRGFRRETQNIPRP